MKKIFALMMVTTLMAFTFDPAVAASKKANELKRQATDQMAKDTLTELYKTREQSKAFFDGSYGYAVFNNVKLSLMVSAGGGQGVAVDKKTGKRTYMRMGTAGVNIGLGAQKYQVIFLFEDKKIFDNFVNKGWQADANANAVAGTSGLNAEATFKNGIAVYQITEAGLMLQADISGTKYWKNKKLNKK
jgi:lipid-binding SYLF domain-containing protein